MEPKDLRSSYNPNLRQFDTGSSDEEKDNWDIDPKSVDLVGSLTSLPGKWFKSTVNKAASLLPVPKGPLVNSEEKAEKAAKSFKQLNLDDRDTSEQLEDLRKASASARQILPNISQKTVKDLQGPLSNRDWFPCLAAFVNSMEIDENLKLKFLDFESQMHKYLSGKANNNIPKNVVRSLLLNHFLISKINGDPKAVESAVRDLLNPSKWVEGIYEHFGKEADQLVIGFILDFPELLNLGLDDDLRLKAAKDFIFLQNLTHSALPKEQKEELNRLFGECKQALKTYSGDGGFFNLAILSVSELAETYRHPVVPAKPEPQPQFSGDVVKDISKIVRMDDKSSPVSPILTLFNELPVVLKENKFLALSTMLELRDVPNYPIFNQRLDLLERQLAYLLDDHIDDREELEIAVEKTMNLIFEKSGFYDLDPKENPIQKMLEFLNDDEAVFAAFFEVIAQRLKSPAQQFCNSENLVKFAALDKKLEAFFNTLPDPKPILERFALKFRLLDFLSRECDPTEFLNADNSEQTNRLFHPIRIVFRNIPPLQLIIQLRGVWGTKGIQYTSLNENLDDFLNQIQTENKEAFKNFLFDVLLGTVQNEEHPMRALTLLISKPIKIADILYRPIIEEYLSHIPPSTHPLQVLNGIRDHLNLFNQVIGLKSHKLCEDLNFLLNLPFVEGSQSVLMGIIHQLSQPNGAELISKTREVLEGGFFTKIGPDAVAKARESLGERTTGLFVKLKPWTQWGFPPSVEDPKPVRKEQLIDWLNKLNGDPITDFICMVQSMNVAPDPAILSSYFNFSLVMNTIFEAMNLNTREEKRLFLGNLVTDGGAKQINSDALPNVLRYIQHSDTILKAMIGTTFANGKASDEQIMSLLAGITNIAPSFPPESNMFKINEHIVRILAACEGADKGIVISYLQNLVRTTGSNAEEHKVFISVLSALYYLDDLEPLLEYFRTNPGVLGDDDPLRKLNRAVDIMLAIARKEKSNEAYVAMFEGLKAQIKLVQNAEDPASVYWLRNRLLDCERSLFQGDSQNVLIDFTTAIGRVNLSLQLEDYIVRTIDNILQGLSEATVQKGGIVKMLGKGLMDRTQRWAGRSEKLEAALGQLREPLVDLIGRISTKDLLGTVLDQFSDHLVFGVEKALASLELKAEDRKELIANSYQAREAISTVVYEVFVKQFLANLLEAQFDDQSMQVVDFNTIANYFFKEEIKSELKTKLQLSDTSYYNMVQSVAKQWSKELEHYAQANPKTRVIIEEYWQKSVDPEHNNDRIVETIFSMLKNYVEGPVNQLIEAKFPIGKGFLKERVQKLIETNVQASLDQLLKSGQDGWLILGLLEPFIPSQVPLPVDNGGAPSKLNPHKNPNEEALTKELIPPLLNVVSVKGGYAVSTVAKIGRFIPGYIGEGVYSGVLAPVFQSLESINIPELVAQLSKGLSKPPFPDQSDKMDFDAKASQILQKLIAIKKEIIALEENKPEGWKNTIQGKKAELHDQNAILYKMLIDCPYACDPEISKTYQDQIVTNPQAQEFLHDALLAQYNRKISSLLGEEFVKKVCLLANFTGNETLIGGLKPVLEEIGVGLPHYLTSPLFAEKFGKIFQKVVMIALIEQLEISDAKVDRATYKQ